MKILFLSLLLVTGLFRLYAQDFAVGSTSITFIDPERNNRQIPTAIYYPAETAGQNVPVSAGEFPVIAFGHGFIMVHTAYQFLWLDLVAKGYILAFPTTEGSFAPSHLNFGLDLAFIISAMKTEGQDENSIFYEKVAQTSAVMGHSMGGGASFLACENNTEPTTIVTFAAANTSPSSIQAAAGVTIPTLLFAGEFDCVTPPSEHQYPMYEATASDQKIIIDIYGGGHCYFADYNLFCSIGEASCSPQPATSREEQQQTTLDFLNLYFDFLLKGDENAGQVFFDSLQSSPRIDYLMDWNTVSARQKRTEHSLKAWPNPFRNEINIELSDKEFYDSIIILNAMGQKVFEAAPGDRTMLHINTRSWSRGAYMIYLSSPDRYARKKVFKR